MIQSYKKLFWTEHSKIKMKQYGLSKQKLLNILYKPERKEQGIVPGTIAVMRTNKSYSNILKKKNKVLGEIWIMYKNTKDLKKIISAWRYPGISKPGDKIPIPEDILQELLNQINK